MNIKELKELIQNIDDDVIVGVEWLDENHTSRMGVADIAYVIHDEEKPNYYFMFTHSVSKHPVPKNDD